MNKSINELGAENVLAKKSLDENKQIESASENEESDTVTEQSTSSSSSSETTNTQNSLSNSSKQTNSKRKSNSAASSTTVTQFSVQRSDVDGLRMKISAIRPTNPSTITTNANATATTITKPVTNIQQKSNQTAETASNRESWSASKIKTKVKSQNKSAHTAVAEKMHYNNNNCLTKPLTVKLSNIKLQQQKTKSISNLTTSTEPHLQVRCTAEKPTDGRDTTVKNMSVDFDGGQKDHNAKLAGAVEEGVCGVENAISADAAVLAVAKAELPKLTAAPLLVLPLSQASCLSDATAESGCSEATTTTMTGGAERPLTARRVRVKRKKTQSKLAQEHKKPALSAAAILKSARTQQLHNLMTYTSDSDEETQQQQPQQQQQQHQHVQKRAPRLLLTAINNTNTSYSANDNEQQMNPLPAITSSLSALTATTATFSHGSDNSDNELKLDDVVNEVIKRVGSDADDIPTTATEAQRKARATTKRVPQYQSTLLQDFMEKTQMLGSNSTSNSSVAAGIVEQNNDNLMKSTSSEERLPPTTPIQNNASADAEKIAQADNIEAHPPAVAAPAVTAPAVTATITTIIKKKRGRPKKCTLTTNTSIATSPSTNKEVSVIGTPTSVIVVATTAAQTTTAMTAAAASSIASNINESADSGVISTTSTTATQYSNTSPPSPKCAARNTNSATTPTQKRRQRAVEHTAAATAVASASENVRQQSISPCKSQTQDGSGSCSANSPKPKIDIAYLDKRMYAATERVLYPPPRNKRRQSMCAAASSVQNAIMPTTPTSKTTGSRPSAASSSTAAGNSVVTQVALVAAKTITKEELQLDPVWRKIDVNKKFRRPSLSGYKSDGGGGNTTICSKILAAKSGYVSDYSSFHARAPRDHSGYKSDASGKSRYSMKSCASRRSRAKSCGYRSDCKDGKDAASLKSAKYRRKRRSALMRAHSKSVGNLAATLNDAEKDILQLAGLSLGQSSEESNEYVCKPNLESLPTTSASKKYGEINRFIATGEYFGRGSSNSSSVPTTAGGGAGLFPGNLHDQADLSGSQDGYGFSRKLLLQRKHSVGIGGGGGGGAGASQIPGGMGTAHDMLLPHPHTSRKIKSRRSSIASYCSSYYSTTSKVRKRHRRKSFLRFPSSGKSGVIIDSKLLTEIDILANTFSARCRIQSGGGPLGVEKSSGSNSSKDKMLVESGSGSTTSNKLQNTNPTPLASSGSKREQRDKRSLKKRKMSENQEYALMSGSAGVGSNVGAMLTTPGSGAGAGSGGGAKRRHKKANSSSSPDDHKLPLKKRHYLLTPGEKSTEAAVAAKLFGSTAVEAWAAAVASTKLASMGKTQHHHNQQQFGSICGSNSATLSVAGSTHSGGSTKSSKTALTPKKRQFPQQEDGREVACNTPKFSGSGNSHHSNSSPLRIAIDSSTLSHKLLDISPISLAGSAKQSDVVHRKRSRLEVLVSKIVATTSSQTTQGGGGAGAGEDAKDTTNVALLSKQKQTEPSATTNRNQQQHVAADTPPPGVFEPSVALEIQIPPIARLNDTATGGVTSSGGAPMIITKAEVNSPLMLQEMTPPNVIVPTSATATAKTEGGGASTRIVEASLKSGATASLLLKRKRKKINRTGFPNVRRRKKCKINEQLLLNIAEDKMERVVPTLKRRSRGDTKQTPPPPAPLTNGPSAEGDDSVDEDADESASATTAPITPQADMTATAVITSTPEKALCDRVPIAGEATDSFLERANRTPRLSVVALERLRGTPTPTTSNTSTCASATATSTPMMLTPLDMSVTGANAAVAHKENSLAAARKGRGGRKPKKNAAKSEEPSTAEQTPRKSRVNTTVVCPCLSTADTCTPTTPKSSKRAKVTEASSTASESTIGKIISVEKAQPLAVTNNALPPRARGRRPKLSAAAILTTTTTAQTTPHLPPAASVIAKEQKLNATQQLNKTPTKETRKVATTTTTTITTPSSNSSKKSLDRPASFSKSTVHKIITAKSLESKVKLPAGIDPNTNFSCKIRLKRPSTKKAAAAAALASALRQSMDSIGDGSSIKDVPQSTPEQIATESAAKDSNINYPEQDILPRSETPYIIDSEAATTSDTSDEKCSTITSASSVSLVTAAAPAVARKISRLKRNYLPAGLFSDYFKQLQTPVINKRLAEKRDTAARAQATATASAGAATPPTTTTHSFSAITEMSTSNVALVESNSTSSGSSNANSSPQLPCLPPPPYCEQYFRRTQIDFQLPYDIWWAYTNSKLPSRITVPSWNYRKIRTNIYADAVRPNTAGLDHPTCNCKPDQGCGDNCLNRMVYTECSPSTCPAREKCRNQKIQRHEVAPGVERFMTTDKGWGVRTKLPIVKGTYILEYVGEVVTDREFKDRMGTIYLNDIHHYCLHLDGGLVIDGHRMGSDCRFVNHSCQPNCEIQKWSVNGLSRMALFAKRNIEPGEELSYDYNFSLFNPAEGQPCRCNTPQCRGVIGGKSQRIKPLPIEMKTLESTPKDARSGRPRKRQARKNTERVHSKDVVISHGQQLSEKEKKFVKQRGIFLVRNFEKNRRRKAKRNTNASNEIKVNGISLTSATPPQNNIRGGGASPTYFKGPAAITTRRSSTPAALTTSLTAIRSPRSMKRRSGLTHAVQDPDVEKMAKISMILRDICLSLELLKDSKDKRQTLVTTALTTNNTTAGGATKSKLDGTKSSSGDNGVGAGVAVNLITATAAGGNRKKKSLKMLAKSSVTAATKTTATTPSTASVDLKMVQTNVEQGYYKLPSEFNADMQRVFETAQQLVAKGSRQEAALQELIAAYECKKRDCYTRLLEIVGGDDTVLAGFVDKAKLAEEKYKLEASLSILQDSSTFDTTTTIITPTSNEDIIRCICGLHKDEGLMIQCARCMVWQHTECTKADINADNYLCERCEPRIVDREIPLDDYTEDGHRYYLTLMRGDLHVRQGDAVYVLRDIPVKDAAGNVIPKQKHTYETIGTIDYNECDIFRVERLWKNEMGKRFIFGHHFLRPHETFHEPTRRFYPNEVVRVPLYEIVPIELVIGRCWVLDRTTFCKGRPVECTDEAHCYICELRVDKTARFFSKAKVNYPTCTKTYAFRKFPEKLKICKSYAPHDVDPALLKPKRQKSDVDILPNAKNSNTQTGSSLDSSTNTTPLSSKQNMDKVPQVAGRRRRNSCIPAPVHIYTAIPPSQQTIKQKRTNLESVLKTMKLKTMNTQTAANEQPIDLSYLLSGRRQRKTQSALAANSMANNTTANSTTVSTTTSATTRGGGGGTAVAAAAANSAASASTAIKSTSMSST